MVLNIIALMDIKNKELTLCILTSKVDHFVDNSSTSALAFKWKLRVWNCYSLDVFAQILILNGPCHRVAFSVSVNLEVMVEYRMKDESSNFINGVGKLSLIDLADSKRAIATDQRTLRSLEGANINISLLALNSCINALVEGKKHVPYRNSKLTQLLKDSVGGTCNSVMIVNISPSNLLFSETQNTLHWADRAKEIRTKVRSSTPWFHP
nr:kinesin-like protein KIN-8A [Tanacetum cinerariifolium]